MRCGRTSLLVRSESRHWLVPLLLSAGHAAGAAVRELGGGRGGATAVTTPEGEVVLRPCRRGGLPARFLRETYFGWRPRPFRELRTLAWLRARGVPAVEPLGAVVRWVAPGCYRGWLVTRYESDARTLWEWTATGAGDSERAAVWRQVGASIRRLHRARAAHPDLNVRNILLCIGPRDTRVVFVDFDRPSLSAWCHGQGADLRRLRRSARKLDPDGSRITESDLEYLRRGYEAAGA